MAAEYGKLTVARLKIKLIERGASTRGRKEDLIERLEAYDRNHNFKQESVNLPAPTIVNWPTSGFKQLHIDHHRVLPHIHRSVVEGYFLYQQVSDGGGAKDLKALIKGDQLLQARNVDAISLYKDENAVYFTCIVRAAMKKKDPLSRQNILVWQKKRARSSSSLEDPRPPVFRNMPGYGSQVRSLVLNYCAIHSEDLALRYLYKKADLQTAVLDHDYCASPWTENWVDERNMVTDKDVEEIEKKTREQSKSRLWHEERAWRITASRFGDILNSTERRDKDKLCRSLLYTCDISTPAVIHGKQCSEI